MHRPVQQNAWKWDAIRSQSCLHHPGAKLSPTNSPWWKQLDYEQRWTMDAYHDVRNLSGSRHFPHSFHICLGHSRFCLKVIFEEFFFWHLRLDCVENQPGVGPKAFQCIPFLSFSILFYAFLGFRDCLWTVCWLRKRWNEPSAWDQCAASKHFPMMD